MDYLKFSEFAKDDKRLEGPKKRIDEVQFCSGYNLERKYVTENDKIQFILNNATEALHL